MKLATLLAVCLAATASAAGPAHWVVAWGASPAPQLPDEAQMRTAKLMLDNQTIREIVHTSIASDTVRVRLSNAYGKQADRPARAYGAVGSVKLAFGSRQDVIDFVSIVLRDSQP